MPDSDDRRAWSARAHYQGTVAERYDDTRLATPGARRKWRAEHRQLERALAMASAGDTLLDVPCGNGRFLGVAGDAGLKIVGADVSFDMLLNARRKRDGQRHRLVLADIERMPFEDHSFDHAMCLRFMNLVPPAMVQSSMAELARVASRYVFVQIRVGRGSRASAVIRPLRRSASRCAALVANRGRLPGLSHSPYGVHSRAEFEAACRRAGLETCARLEVRTSVVPAHPDPLLLYVLRRAAAPA